MSRSPISQRSWWLDPSSRVQVAGVGPCEVVEVGDERSDGVQSSFSVLLDVPDDRASLTVDDQGVYEVSRGDVSEHLLLVPIGPTRFEAVFTHLRESA